MFNFNDYISKYSGNGKIQRLCFIGDNFPDYEIQSWSLIENILTNKIENNDIIDIELYTKCMNKLNKPIDKTCISNIESKVALQLEQLQNDLTTANRNLQRNNVRSTLIKIGKINAERGFYSTALKAFFRCRQYNSTPENIIELCMNIIKIQCNTSSASRAQSYITKAENSIKDESSIIYSQLKAASALVSLSSDNYKTAAHKFIDIPFSIGESFNDVISLQDIATCGVICALATFSRKEMKNLLLGNREFKNYLELTPLLQQLIESFYHCDYSSFLNYLNDWKINGELNYLLSSHLEYLLREIRNKALIQYFTPYFSISMNTMSNVFHCNVNELENELSKLIMDGKINARIDSQNKILIAAHTDQRITTYQQAITMGEQHQQDISAFILRSNLLKHNFIVENKEKTGFMTSS